jgi:hypothetical protein
LPHFSQKKMVKIVQNVRKVWKEHTKELERVIQTKYGQTAIGGELDGLN